MAKKKVTPPADLNKSAEIRKYKEANPNKQPKEIAEALTAKFGTEFKAANVSTVLFQAKKSAEKKAGKPAAKKAGRAAAKPAAKGSDLDAALAFAQEAGGLDQAEAALAKLREIKEKL